MTVILAFAFLALAGCVAGEQEIPAQKPEPGEVEVDLAINIRSADNSMSRADYDLEKTPEECKITSVSIFLVPVTAGTEDWANAQYRMIFNPEIVSGYYQLSFKIKSPGGKKHIYAAANMSHAQTLAFMDTDGAYRSAGTTYKAVIDEFADATSSGKGIVMIAQLTKDDEQEIDLSNTATGDFQTDDIDLVRVVSKVLMVCKTDNTVAGAVEGVDYGIATDNANTHNAWIRLDNVYFGLNPTGKVLYRQETTPPDDYVNIASPVATPPAASEWMKTLKYDASRIGEANAASDNHYTEGLYCLANRASAKATAVSTSLVVCVKCLPRQMVTGYASGARTLTTYANEADVEAALAAQAGQLDEDGNPTAYPAGTYWRLDDFFYSYDGMVATIAGAPIEEGVKRVDFLPYIASRGYYEADIDVSLNLLRNYYYILTVEKFGMPRHTLTVLDGGEMLINSQKTEWIPKGVQSVVVKPE